MRAATEREQAGAVVAVLSPTRRSGVFVVGADALAEGRWDFQKMCAATITGCLDSAKPYRGQRLHLLPLRLGRPCSVNRLGVYLLPTQTKGASDV